ncbi:hypothetical protein [Dyadobacter bucti]|uniref:hypothetical protein n=1 Tax=Dyadobacter bucti TaxID=2572203 RepID=UPI003F6E550C
MKVIRIGILCLIFLSCQKKETPGCGCDGPSVKVVENVQASYLGNSHFLLRLTGDSGSPYEEIVRSCTLDEAWTKTAEITNPDYLISAELKRGCGDTPSYSSIYLPDQFKIISIEKVF